MTEQKQIYKCEICGNIVEILHNGVGELVCCAQPMNLQIEKEIEEGNEKHVPVIEQNEKGILVKVGSVEHPMEEKHYIEWIEVQVNGKEFKKFLKAGEKPEMRLCAQAGDAKARAYCNVHGLWKSK